ncbi:hypothetical protein ABIE85_001084 [Bradyrhizobium diazoefficiens]
MSDELLICSSVAAANGAEVPIRNGIMGRA